MDGCENKWRYAGWSYWLKIKMKEFQIMIFFKLFSKDLLTYPHTFVLINQIPYINRGWIFSFSAIHFKLFCILSWIPPTDKHWIRKRFTNLLLCFFFSCIILFREKKNPSSLKKARKLFLASNMISKFNVQYLQSMKWMVLYLIISMDFSSVPTFFPINFRFKTLLFI